MGAGVNLWRNMAVAVAIASPIMYRSLLARPRMVVVVSCEGSDPSGRWTLIGWDRESKRERAMAFVREMEVKESTIPLGCAPG